MKPISTTLLALLVLLSGVHAQDDDNWPSLSYLRSDYKAVAAVVHVRVQQAEITARIPGYDNWSIRAEVLEPFKGKFKKGDVIDFMHGAEAGFKRETFMGEKIVFLLAEKDKDGKIHYSVLENSTLPYTQNRVAKLRTIKRTSTSKHKRLH